VLRHNVTFLGMGCDVLGHIVGWMGLFWVGMDLALPTVQPMGLLD